MKKWSVAQLNKERALAISEQNSIPMICAALLDIRGITTQDDIDKFLSDYPCIDDPFDIKDMDKAVERIKLAVETGEKICVYGDFDADGVTATTLLYQYLETLGADVCFYIPSRADEGYGMHNEAVEKLSSDGVKLIVTVDNGISAVSEVEYASSLGIDVVITDHHAVPEILPDAVAVVDLHREDCNSRFKELSGVGVAFKLVLALEGEYADIEMLLDEYSDILALGTIGDVVDLTDENRDFVKYGLEKIKNSDRAGIVALLKASGCYGKELTATDLSYSIVPRINAGGRLGLSAKSVELLLTDDEEVADEIAAALSEDNVARQKIEQDILKDIDKIIKADPSIIRQPIIILDGDNWHQGVIGIIAARIKGAFGKPCIIISREGDTARASGRSIDGFSLSDAVFTCSNLLVHFGGHPMAVGFSLLSSNIELFKEALYRYVDSMSTVPLPTVSIDCKLNPALLNLELVDALSLLEPYGAGNPSPLFGLYNMMITEIKPVSGGKHQRITVTRSNVYHSIMCFGYDSENFLYQVGDVVDLAVALDKNTYRNNTSLTVIVREIRYSSLDTEKHLLSERLFDRFVLGKEITKGEADSLLPDRNDFATVYRYLKSKGSLSCTFENLCFNLSSLPCGKLKVCLIAMTELNLITFFENPKLIKIDVLEVGTKVDLSNSAIIKKLTEVCSWLK